MHFSVNSRRASITYWIYLANQNNPRKRQWKTDQDVANQNKLRHSSTYDVVTSCS